LPDQSYVLVLKFVDLEFICSKLNRVSRHLAQIIEAENYIMFKHFLRSFNLLNERLKRADIPARAPIKTIMKDNFELRKKEAAKNLHPFSYFTDGGTYNDTPNYFINNIFSTSGVCYSSKTPNNTNVQIYIGREIQADPQKMLPKDHKVKGHVNQIQLPYEKHFKDPESEETFKVLDEFEMRNMGSGYTCFVKAFAMFISDREVKIAKSPIIKFFEGINSVE